MKKEYIFKSERLGFRTWIDEDLEPMAAINADEEVMEFFTNTQSRERTVSLIQKMNQLYKNKGFCFFAVDRLDNEKLIGFIGLSEADFEADFMPAIDIGWRLDKTEWNKGFATEGAKRCLAYAANDLKLEKVISIAALPNIPSINVMKKIGMTKIKTFEHPLLADDERLKICALYEIKLLQNGVSA